MMFFAFLFLNYSLCFRMIRPFRLISCSRMIRPFLVLPKQAKLQLYFDGCTHGKTHCSKIVYEIERVCLTPRAPGEPLLCGKILGWGVIFPVNTQCRPWKQSSFGHRFLTSHRQFKYFFVNGMTFTVT